jgi:hypothetical protein
LDFVEFFHSLTVGLAAHLVVDLVPDLPAHSAAHPNGSPTPLAPEHLELETTPEVSQALPMKGRTRIVHAPLATAFPTRGFQSVLFDQKGRTFLFSCCWVVYAAEDMAICSE